MDKRIGNEWRREQDVEIADILRHDVHPEGFDLVRVRFADGASYTPKRDHGSIVSVLEGSVRVTSAAFPELELRAGTHIYMPPNSAAQLHGRAGAQLVHLMSPKASRSRGARMLLRDEQFLPACSLPGRALRWILTPQYLSRRVFLHHDQTLVSKSGDPVSWFHTTMFDVAGLSNNDEGRPVFKMSYNYRTEPNICFRVEGKAAVRMALHPYSDEAQGWGPWLSLDSQTTYHLNESPADAEWRQVGDGRVPHRNKHEVFVDGGFVSLLCLFDPAPTGVEHHQSGAYSSYGDLSATLGTSRYAEYLRALEPLDAMVEALSLARARGEEPSEQPHWSHYQDGLQAQREVEAALYQQLQVMAQGREAQIRPWMQDTSHRTS